jgi:hypothetical protein
MALMTRRLPRASADPEDAPAEDGPTAYTLPIEARVRLAHAVVQRVAETRGISLLHLKGPALLPGLRPVGRLSSDADVLVDPDQVAALRSALTAHGWALATSAERASPFGHAENWWHPSWGMVDVHRSWPGTSVGARATVDGLAEGSGTVEIGHVECPVPDRVAQIFVLLLHGARSISPSDKALAWDEQDDATRAAVLALAERLGAQVAMSAALGDLDAHRDSADYDLWRFYRDGGSRLDEWRARLRATKDPGARMRLLIGALQVDKDYLAQRLGRPPTRRDLLTAQRLRAAHAARDLLAVLRGRSR